MSKKIGGNSIIVVLILANLRDALDLMSERKRKRERAYELRERPLFEAALATQGNYEYRYRNSYQIFGLSIFLLSLLYLSDRLFFNIVIPPLSHEDHYEQIYSWVGFVGVTVFFIFLIREFIFPLAPIALTKNGLEIRFNAVSRKTLVIPWKDILGVYFKSINSVDGRKDIPLKGWWVKEKIMGQAQGIPVWSIELLWLFLNPQFAKSNRSSDLITEDNQLILYLREVKGKGPNIVDQIKEYWEHMTG